MKSFLLFHKLLFLNLIVTLCIIFFTEKNSESIYQNKIVFYLIFLFSLISFTYVYIFDKYKTNKSLKFGILISILFITILMFLLGYIIQILLHNHVNLITLLYQSILAICVFIFEILIINFYINFHCCPIKKKPN